jgi:hypothetical protein
MGRETGSHEIRVVSNKDADSKSQQDDISLGTGPIYNSQTLDYRGLTFPAFLSKRPPPGPRGEGQTYLGLERVERGLWGPTGRLMLYFFLDPLVTPTHDALPDAALHPRLRLTAHNATHDWVAVLWVEHAGE